MAAVLVRLLMVLCLCTACGSERTSEPTAEGSPSTTSSAGTAASGIVGRWTRVVTCQELTSELRKAQLGPLMRYAWSGQTSSTGQSSFAAGSPEPSQAHPCSGAIARKHSHFFDQSGQFGSLDWLGGQVDDGHYQLGNENTLRIGDVTFHYRLVHHDTLYLDPVLTNAMVHQARAHPSKFSDAGWAVSVAYSGHPWKRAPCDGLC